MKHLNGTTRAILRRRLTREQERLIASLPEDLQPGALWQPSNTVIRGRDTVGPFQPITRIPESMSYDLTGVIRHIEPEQTFASGFSKREFVVTTDDKYPQDIKLEFVKDKTVQLDDYQPGDRVRVAFNIRGNEYQGRFYVNLVAWKIDADGEARASAPSSGGYRPPANAYAQPSRQPANASAPRQANFYEDPTDEDIPF